MSGRRQKMKILIVDDLFARWQYQDLDLDLVGTNAAGVNSNVSQGFDEWNLIQVGGVIFF